MALPQLCVAIAAGCFFVKAFQAVLGLESRIDFLALGLAFWALSFVL